MASKRLQGDAVDIWDEWSKSNSAHEYQQSRLKIDINNSLKNIGTQLAGVCADVVEFSESCSGLNVNATNLILSQVEKLKEAQRNFEALTAKVKNLLWKNDITHQQFRTEAQSLMLLVEKQMIDANDSNAALVSHVMENPMSEIETMKANHQVVFGNESVVPCTALNPNAPRIQVVAPQLNPRTKSSNA